MTPNYMEIALDRIKRDHDVVKVVRHGNPGLMLDAYIAVFTADDVAHIWIDGNTTWEHRSLAPAPSNTSNTKED